MDPHIHVSYLGKRHIASLQKSQRGDNQEGLGLNVPSNIFNYGNQPYLVVFKGYI